MSNLQIERFTSWDEIFPDPTETERQYTDLLAGIRAEYGDTTLQTTEIDPETGLTITTFEGNGIHEKVQRLANGNVRMNFTSGNVWEITPEIGNKAHEWTYHGVKSLARGLEELYQLRKGDPLYRTELYLTICRVRGKSATMGWEEVFLGNGALPQRIGYILYPENDLRNAQRHLAQSRPRRLS